MKRLPTIALALTLGLTAAACGGSDDGANSAKSSASTGSGASAATASASGTSSGAAGTTTTAKAGATTTTAAGVAGAVSTTGYCKNVAQTDLKTIFGDAKYSDPSSLTKRCQVLFQTEGGETSLNAQELESETRSFDEVKKNLATADKVEDIAGVGDAAAYIPHAMYFSVKGRNFLVSTKYAPSVKQPDAATEKTVFTAIAKRMAAAA